MSFPNCVPSSLLTSNMNGGNIRKLKLAILGDKQVGKSSLLTRFTKGRFNPMYLHTKGGDMCDKFVTVNGDRVHLSMIDSAGHYYVRSLIKSLYRNVHGIMIVFDVTKEKTFDSLIQWLQEIEMVNNNSPFLIVVGNKCDLILHKAVPPERAEMFSSQRSLTYMEVSAKTGMNVSQAFQHLIEGTYREIIPDVHNMTSIKLNDIPDERDDVEGEHQCCR